MTLIISCAARHAIVQVSDRRLTMPDGTLVDGAANKALCLCCLDAHVAVAYTGLARITGVQTDRWLLEAFLSINSGTRPLAEVGAALRDRLTNAFRHLKNVSNRHLTVIVAGYRDSSPFWGCLSNQMGPNGEELNVPADKFALLMPRIQWDRARKAFLAVSGELRAVPDALDTRIKKRQRRLHYQSPYVTAGQLVSYVRISARAKTYGAHIGRDCTAVVVLPDGRFHCRAYPEHATPVSFMPHILFGRAALQDVTFEARQATDNGSPS